MHNGQRGSWVAQDRKNRDSVKLERVLAVKSFVLLCTCTLPGCVFLCTICMVKMFSDIKRSGGSSSFYIGRLVSFHIRKSLH